MGLIGFQFDAVFPKNYLAIFIGFNIVNLQ